MEMGVSHGIIHTSGKFGRVSVSIGEGCSVSGRKVSPLRREAVRFTRSPLTGALGLTAFQSSVRTAIRGPFPICIA